MDATSTPAYKFELVSSIADVTAKPGKRYVDFIILQLNDVYEAGPVEGGRLGGVARVATLRQSLERENPNLLVVMSGDFLAPSVISATTGDSGQHMIEALNAAGVTHCTVGNHEFDISESDLVLRVAESKFRWVISNVTNARGRLFAKMVKNDVVEFSNPQGAAVRVGLIGLCLDMAKKTWVKYQDPLTVARQQVEELAPSADVLVALTHLKVEQDKQLATDVAELDVLMGGHEHEAATAIVGEDATPIFKADSNARSACVHRFRFDTKTNTTKLHTQLLPIDTSIAEDPETAAIVAKWQKVTFDTLRAQGINPDEIVGYTQEPLIGDEKLVRSGPTNLTDYIVNAFLAEVPNADAVLYSSGLIRLDGVIPAGNVTYFDVVRIFPVGGRLSVLSLPGSLVKLLLSIGESSKGTGGYQALANITRAANGAWLIKGAPIVDDQMYRIVAGDMPVAAFSYPPFKGSGAAKEYDTREVRAILADRFRADRALLEQSLAQKSGAIPASS